MKRICIFIIFLLSSPQAFATDVLVSLGSWHVGKPSNSNLNEFNPGIALSHKNWTAGLFRNSFSGTSYHFGRRIPLGYNFSIEAGVSNYGNFEFSGKSKIIPIGQLSYDYKLIRVGYVPYFTDSYDGIVTFQLRIPIK